MAGGETETVYEEPDHAFPQQKPKEEIIELKSTALLMAKSSQ